MTLSRSTRSAAIAFAAVLTLAAAVLAGGSAQPARAFPTSASFTAVDYQWAETGSGGAGTTVHIEPGGTVNFEYPSGFSTHNADFGATPPTSCSQATGTNSGGVPPLPAVPTSAAWSGSCVFNTTGTYTFRCDLHASMHGTVLVGDVPDPTPPTGGGSQGGGSGGGGGSTNSNPVPGLKLTSTQHGTKVKGAISSVAERSSLSVDVTAKTSSLKSSVTTTRVGRYVKSHLPAGDLSFSVKVNGKARGAIKRRGKLRLTVTVKLTPPGGQTVRTTKTVTLKRG